MRLLASEVAQLRESGVNVESPTTHVGCAYNARAIDFFRVLIAGGHTGSAMRRHSAVFASLADVEAFVREDDCMPVLPLVVEKYARHDVRLRDEP